MAMNRLKDARTARGMTQDQLAKAVGTTQSQVGKLEAGKRRITLDWAVRLAGALGIRPSELIDGTADAGASSADAPPFANARPDRQSPGAADGTMPVYGVAMDWCAATPRLAMESAGWVATPAGLAGVSGAYGLYVADDSMRPRYRPAQLLYVHPHRPLSDGAGVVLRLRNGSILLREWVRLDAKAVVLREYHPEPRDIRVPRSDVEAVHVVVGLWE